MAEPFSWGQAMPTEHNAVQLRQYVLGELSPDACDAIERDYFERADAIDRLRAAEDELIDDYLSARLPQTERALFERHYLSTPNHRRRVAVMRAIRTAAAARVESTPVGSGFSQVWRRASALRSRSPEGLRHDSLVKKVLPIAASIVLLVGAGLWLLRPQQSDRDTVAVQSPAAPSNARESAPPQPADPSRGIPTPRPVSPPVVVAVSLSPVLVRSLDEPAVVTIRAKTDIVRLQLRGLAGDQPGAGRALVRTVGGREVWRGSATPISGSPSQALARVDVPAATLPPDDYIVELLGSDASGRDIERHRYFLRVQTP